MRNAFADEITKVAISNEKVVLLSGDIGNKLFDQFKLSVPKQFYNCGVAEANMTGVAAGLAMMGFRPFTYSITPFVTVRCLEQVRVDVCYHDLPVTIVGTGAGFSYTELGPTHHSCDDIGFLRMLPNISIICPCDAIEVREAIWASLEQAGPVYIRLGKKGEPVIHNIKPKFTIGRSMTVRAGKDICILSTGNVMPLALSVADRLQQVNIQARVESFHTVKPLDQDLLKDIFANYSIVATIEEHSLIGGLGSAIAEWIVDSDRINAKFIRFGTRDEFLPYIGSQEYARSYFDLTEEKIVNRLLVWH
ncbi:MAG TPA: transketolase C-terminal domain-containing protein [Gammaproteobacteria bacterium]|nr:transketolase C-terminal domain-containing protein [Gammaproteobacteria bacterium]